jgi:hypothetical protein
MNVRLNRLQFVDSLLNPASKIADNLQLHFVSEDGKQFCKTTTNSNDNTVIFLSKIPCSFDKEFSAIIPECKTFLRLFANVDQEEITLELNVNSIVYQTPAFSFKYHLLDESYIINKKTISEAKLNELKFDTTFRATKQKINDIVKYNSIIPEAEKVYFFTNEAKEVCAKVGDKERTNVNEIIFNISQSFAGNSLSLDFPLNVQNILLFSFSQNEIEISVNQQLKVFKFETAYSKYIISGLIK